MFVTIHDFVNLLVSLSLQIHKEKVYYNEHLKFHKPSLFTFDSEIWSWNYFPLDFKGTSCLSSSGPCCYWDICLCIWTSLSLWKLFASLLYSWPSKTTKWYLFVCFQFTGLSSHWTFQFQLAFSMLETSLTLSSNSVINYYF